MHRDVTALNTGDFDLLVCGGGIYGAWTAYDAALRGLRVVLVEQGDWASGTSSASSKLIHGGLRYLEQLDLKLVHKALSERQMLLHAAPHRVWPLRFGVPLYRHGRVGRWKLKAGLMLYDWLAHVSTGHLAHQSFSATAFASAFPLLKHTDLLHGFSYADAQTDDARLVLELVAGALAAGAVCVNYAQVADWVLRDGRVCGARIRDLVSGAELTLGARQVVSTQGRWDASSETGRAWCRLSKGVHLVMPGLAMEQALLLTAPSDGRVFFLIPWYGRTLLGTTDTDYHGRPDQVTVTPEDVRYLLDAANHYLQIGWQPQDVLGEFVGVRVMKSSEQASPSSVSRDWALRQADNGVFYSIGGKITSAREDCAAIVDQVSGRLRQVPACRTRARPFPWTPAGDYERWRLAQLDHAAALGVDSDSAQWLLRRHGRHAEQVLALIAQQAALARRIVAELPLIHADLLYCARSEMVVHLHDLLRRRLPLLILARLNEGQLADLAAAIAEVMQWDAARQQQEVQWCRTR